MATACRTVRAACACAESGPQVEQLVPAMAQPLYAMSRARRAIRIWRPRPGVAFETWLFLGRAHDGRLVADKPCAAMGRLHTHRLHLSAPPTARHTTLLEMEMEMQKTAGCQHTRACQLAGQPARRLCTQQAPSHSPTHLAAATRRAWRATQHTA